MNVRPTIDSLIDPIAPVSFTKLGFSIRSRMMGWDDLIETDKTIAVTGPTSGLGEQMARELDAMGASLVLIARNPKKLSLLQASLINSEKHSSVVCDLLNPESIRQAAAKLSHLPMLDAIIHNAGTIFDTHELVDGVERTLLSHVIAPLMLNAGAEKALSNSDDGGRCIYMASGGLYTQSVDATDIHLTREPQDFNGTRAYARAKRIQTIVAELLAAEQTAPLNLAVHPGWVDTPGLAKLLPSFYKFLKPVLRDTTQGIDSCLWLATSDRTELENGAFYHDRSPRSTSYLPKTKTNDQDKQSIFEQIQEITEGLLGSSHPDETQDPESSSG